MQNAHEPEERNQPSAKKAAVVRPMTVEDIPAILAIEELSFLTPWSEESFRSELKDNHLARYFCLEVEGRVIGYIGLWLIWGEGHVTNIAIWPGCRGQGWGEYLLQTIMQRIRLSGAVRMTLEVRVSNYTAKRLYEKLGFKPAGIRKGYYSDNKEDALIMWANL